MDYASAPSHGLAELGLPPISPFALLIFACVALVAFLLLRAAGRALGLGRDTGRGLEMDTASLILGLGLWGSLLVLGVTALLVL